MATFGGGTSLGTTVEQAEIADGAINNAKVAADAAIDRSKLASVAGSGANSDITSLTGLTTPLTEPQGGAGAANQLRNAVGALGALYAKTWINIQLLFILWVGASDGAVDTQHDNWVRNSTDVEVYPGAALAHFNGTGADYISLLSFLMNNVGENIKWDSTNQIILDWWQRIGATGTGDAQCGFFRLPSTGAVGAYNTFNANEERVCFSFKSTGEIYATIANPAANVTNTDVSSGITEANWNNYRIHLTLGTGADFYINGVLVATIGSTNLYTGTGELGIGFGRSNTRTMLVMAPNVALKAI